MIKKIATVVCMGLASFGAFAGVKVTSMDLKTNGAKGHMNIALAGRSLELPDLKVSGNTIEVTLADAEAFNTITKNVNGSKLTAEVVNGKAIIKAVFPYEVNSNAVNLDMKKDALEITFPQGKVAKAPAPVVAPVKAPAKTVEAKKVEEKAPAKTSTVAKESLNEDYLNKLMNEEKKTARRETDAPSETSKDEVKVKQSGIAKTPAAEASSQDGFSFAGYAAKFSAFLALVLGVFYGVVQLLKKGVFNRGKLGFLNNAQMIQVLSTTYVAPKRSLMVVKAHKQIFLVANSENGIQFLSEMTDTSGLIKEGEKVVTGTNFDLNLGSAEQTTTETSFKIKENIHESAPLPEEKGIQGLSAKDIVKFSDELKKKAKKLKPIEFN